MLSSSSLNISFLLLYTPIHLEETNAAVYVGWVDRLYSCSFCVIYSVCLPGEQNLKPSQDLFVVVDNRPVLSCMRNTFIHDNVFKCRNYAKRHLLKLYSLQPELGNTEIQHLAVTASLCIYLRCKIVVLGDTFHLVNEGCCCLHSLFTKCHHMV